MVVLAYELVVIVGLGVWIQKTDKSTEADGFALAHRSLSTPVVAVTMALTVLGTAHILGVFEMAWILGASAVWFSLAHVILLVVVCLGTGVWIRRVGVTTVPQLLQMSLGIETRLLVSCVMAGVLFGILTVEAQGIGIIIASLTQWSIAKGAVIGGIIGILYVVLAGMKEIGLVNLVNAVVMYVGLILATVFIALKLPGGDFSSVSNYYIDNGNETMLSIMGNKEILLTFVLGSIVAVVFSQGINQMLLQPTMAARSEKTIRRALWIAAPVNGLFGVFAVVLGLTAKSIPEFEAMGQKVAATSMLVTYLPSWLGALLLAAFLAAILSTFAMISLSVATIFTHDIYKTLYRPQATDEHITKIIRLVIVVVASIAISIATFLPPILAAMNWLFSWLVPVFWVLLCGLFWRRNQPVAVFTLVGAWVLNSLWSFTALPEALHLEGTPNAIVVAVFSIAALLVGNIVQPGPRGYFQQTESASQ